MSECRGDRDVGLCTFWILAKPEPLRNTKFRFFLRETHDFFSEVPPLRWGWVFLERTRILSGIQFKTHFIEIFVVETK